MRHMKKVKKLGRTASHRDAMLRNMADSLIEHGSIRTTVTRAKVLKAYMDKIITKGKLDNVHVRRQVTNKIRTKDSFVKLFKEILPSMSDRNSGYTRILNLSERRPGDNSPMCLIQFVNYTPKVVKVKDENKASN